MVVSSPRGKGAYLVDLVQTATNDSYLADVSATVLPSAFLNARVKSACAESPLHPTQVSPQFEPRHLGIDCGRRFCDLASGRLGRRVSHFATAVTCHSSTSAAHWIGLRTFHAQATRNYQRAKFAEFSPEFSSGDICGSLYDGLTEAQMRTVRVLAEDQTTGDEAFRKSLRFSCKMLLGEAEVRKNKWMISSVYW